MATEIAWTSFSEENKTKLRALKAVFIMAPREMSDSRLVQLVKENLTKGNVIFGVAEEPFVDGFSGQAHFRTQSLEPVLRLTGLIEKAKLAHTLQVLVYPQKAVDEVIRAIRPRRVVVVRGSYLHVFHRRTTYELLQKRGIPFSYVSPFTDENEAKMYGEAVLEEGVSHQSGDEQAMLDSVDDIAKNSFDYSFQTGAVLAEKAGAGYKLIGAACNEVVPYQTYAMHFGNSREDNLSPRHDANHYDTIHAEMNLLVRTMKQGQVFEGKSLFINMMPCPSCARTLVKTGLKEVVYNEVHSDGYAVKLFEQAGVKTRKAEQ